VAYDVVSVEGLGGTGATITRHVLPEPPERDRSGPSRAAESVGRAGAPAATASTDDTTDDTTGATTATTSG
jgi:hypothetical protein